MNLVIKHANNRQLLSSDKTKATYKQGFRQVNFSTLLLSMEQFQTKKGFLKHQVHEISWKNVVYMQYLHITTIYRLAEKEALHLTS